MKGQHAIESLLIFVGFILVAGIFIKVYSTLLGIQKDILEEKNVEMILDKIAHAVNQVYILGPENQQTIEVAFENYTLYSKDKILFILKDGKRYEKEVLVDVNVQGHGRLLVIENDAGQIKIWAK